MNIISAVAELALAELDDGRQQLAEEGVHVEDSRAKLNTLAGLWAAPSVRGKLPSGP